MNTDTKRYGQRAGSATTDGEQRRVGRYHHGIATRPVTIRLPVWKYERLLTLFEARGFADSFSAGLEDSLDRNDLRER